MAFDKAPRKFADLSEMAMDLRWTGSQFANSVWSYLDAEAWDRCHNPRIILRNAHRTRIEELAHDPALGPRMNGWFDRRDRYLASVGWYGRTHGNAALKRVAYFSMEFGLSEALPIHSGGLGILAGDHLKAASDLGVPVVGVGLLYQQGYFRQMLGADGSQIEAFPYNDPGSLPLEPATAPDGSSPRVELPLHGRTLYVRAWRARVGRTSLYLLDTNDPLNNPWDRGITANLYAAGREKRLLQELVLGAGGWRLLEMLGLEPDVCHLNEGHAAFAVLVRAASFAATREVPFAVALRATRAGNIFTTHTPVPAAFDRFDPELIATYATPFLEQASLSIEQLLAMGRADPHDRSEPFNMAYLAMRGCNQANAVSEMHGTVSRRLFGVLFPERPTAEVPIGHITNGVHLPTWDSPHAHELWSRAFGPDWLERIDEAARAVAGVGDSELWDFRAAARHDLVESVRHRYERQLREGGAPPEHVERARHVLDPNALTLGFARRFTAYKRPTLMLRDCERLSWLARRTDRPVQLIVAGKAHPGDAAGKEMVREMVRFAKREELFDRIVFLQDYDIRLAQQMVGGVDVWVNTPRVTNEACGTSGMKILINGGLHFSTLDGWWAEAYSPDVGWTFGSREDHGGARDHDDACDFYRVLEDGILAEFYDRDAEGIPRAWIARVRRSMVTLAPRFAARRMVTEYTERAYLPAAQAFATRASDHAEVATRLEQWDAKLREEWHALRIVDTLVNPTQDTLAFEVHVHLGELDPDAVRVELYSDHEGGEVFAMERDGPLAGVYNGFSYFAAVPNDQPPEHYTPRIVPSHPDATVPMEAPRIRWRRP